MGSSLDGLPATGEPEPPLIVVEGDRRAFEAAVDEVRLAGWRVVDGFEVPRGDSTALRIGVVGTASDAAAALLVVLAGGGAVIHALGGPDVLDHLYADLRHVRRVDVRRGSRTPAPDSDAVAILAILAEGRTLGDAAATLGLSRRTADRRLAEARRLLGVERTVEAVSRARRLGWLG